MPQDQDIFAPIEPEAAPVRLVTLDQVRDRAGPLWAELAEQARRSAAAFLEQRLGPNDFLIQSGDAFLMFYGDDRQAAARTRELQDTLDAIFLGQDWIPGDGQAA